MSEPGLGSDSFLDVIANMVGILIILIVIAGLRVSEESAATAESPENGSTAVTPQQSASLEPDRELVAQSERLQRELASLSSESARRAAEISQTTKRRDELGRTLASKSELLAMAARDGGVIRDSILNLKSAIGQKQGRLQALEQAVEQADAQNSKATKIEHRLMPMSREVQNAEIQCRRATDRGA
jgi:chromosome segregation ATPase